MLSENKNSIPQGEKNSQYGTCWITNGEINKKKLKKKNLLNIFLMGGEKEEK